MLISYYEDCIYKSAIILNIVINYIRWHNLKGNEMRENKMEISFEKLTPTYNVDLKVYEPAIDFAFKEKDNHLYGLL